MKIAIAGKGGVGKTTLASLLSRAFAAEGRRVIAVDANPDPNLGVALGFPPSEVASLTPIAEMEELIKNRTYIDGYLFKLNPKVDDIPERFSIEKDGIRLLIMGRVKGAGTGCLCPANALLRSLLSHLILERDEVIILDMEAGLEHMSRGTAKGVDAIITVVEPGIRSIESAILIRSLSLELGIRNCWGVGNKIASEEQERFIIEKLKGFEILGFIPFDPKIAEADLKGVGVYECAPDALKSVKKIKERIELLLENG